MGLDWGTYSAFHNLRVRHPRWHTFFEAGHYFGEYGWIGLLLLLWASSYLLYAPMRRRLLHLTGLAALGLILAEGLRLLLDFPRPGDTGGGSFPSKPVLFCSLAITLLWGFLDHLRTPRFLRWCWYLLGGILIVWVIGAQLYLSLNFLSDVLAGLVLGVGLGILCHGISARTS